MRHLTAFLITVTSYILLFPTHVFAEPEPGWAPSSEITVRIGNDLFAGNSRDDDLYTAGLGFKLYFDREQAEAPALGRRFVSVLENTFTDREAGLRFDEGWLLLGRRVERKALDIEYFFGGVRVGRGVLGERAQNAVHRLIGDNEIELDYVAQNRHFAVVGSTLSHAVKSEGRFRLSTRAEALVAFDFQQWLEVAVVGTYRARPWLDLYAELGARYSRTQFDPLKPWIQTLSPSVDLGLILKDKWVLSWTHNEFGTELGHVGISVRLPVNAKLGRKNP